MRFRSGMILALAAGLGLGGCAAAGPVASGPQVSATGRIYEPGTPPRQTRFSQAGTLALVQGNFEQALAQAQEGLAADSVNPIHYFVAGEAHAGLGDFETADQMWREAERIYPAYEIEIEPAREQAWAQAFNDGIEAYNTGDIEGTIAAWRRADMIYRLRPQAAQNLAVLLTEDGEYDEAIRIYRRGLEGLDIEPAARIPDETEIAEREEARAFMRESLADLLLFTNQYAEAEQIIRSVLADDPTNVGARANLASALGRQGREAEATAIYAELLAAPDLSPTQLFAIGVALFNAEEFVRSAEAFGRVAMVRPDDRDAWNNQANALYAAERWAELVPVGRRASEVDPLNENLALIYARGLRETGDNQGALAVLEASQEAPVFIEELQLRPTTTETTVAGRIVGNQAAAGSPVQLRFHFYGDEGQLGTEVVTLSAPATDQSVPLEVGFGQTATAFRYEVVR